MDARFAVADVSPDDLLVSSDLKQADLPRPCVIGRDDRVAVGQPLCATGVVERLRREIVV